mgnify:CR=1 FL=1
MCIVLIIYLLFIIFHVNIYSYSFQAIAPTTLTASSSTNSIQQHHNAVEERVRVLLNLASDVKFSTTPTPAATVTKTKISTTEHTNLNNTNSSNSSSNINKKRNHTEMIKSESQQTDDITPDSSNKSDITTINAIKKERIEDNNIGYKILQQYGWKKDTSIGKNNNIPSVHIDVRQKQDNLGIGAHNNSEYLNNIYDSSSNIEDSEKMKVYKRMLMRYNQSR